MVPAIAAGTAAVLTLAVTGIYVSSVIGQWEDHSTNLESEVATITAERDAAQDKVEAAEARASDAEGALADAQAELEERTAAVAAAEKALSDREAAFEEAVQRVADTSIQEGTWVVGRDIEPGTYRTLDEVGSRCYWGIYRSGSNGDDIIDNDLPGGGFPTVTLSVGQDFKTSSCGDWIKQP